MTTGQNNCFIGNDAGRAGQPGGTVTTQNNKICLGNNQIASFSCLVSLTATSDARDKTDITDFTPGLSWVNKLRPVTYKWDQRAWYGTGVKGASDEVFGIPDGSKKESKINIGLLAQEELEIEKEHGFGNNENDMLVADISTDGNQYSMKYERLVPVLVNAVKELSAENTALKARLDAAGL